MRIIVTLALGLLLATGCDLGQKARPAATGRQPAAKPSQPASDEAAPPAQLQPLPLEPSSGPPVLLWAVPPAKAALDALAGDFAKLHSGGWNIAYLDRAEMLTALAGAAPMPQVLVLADTETADQLRAKGLLEEESLRTFAGDTLVIVCREGTGWECPTVFDLWQLRFTHLGIGDRNATVAGYYGYQALVSDGAWKRISDRVLELPSQAELLSALLEVDNPKSEERLQGSIQLAILPGSAAAVTKGLRGVLAIPSDLHEPLRYQAAAVKGRRGDPGVETVLRLLAEDPAAQVKIEGFGYLGREAALRLQ